ncbi:heavy metal-associated isoprenylated plant protein 2-like [Carya illinoinensis]|uniref:HMA domain-containing protein n=1 Tax=Carya illinoinensis TaxID=32201 RepID=A0A8T1PY19_CARIL|nr:heavy metal-associated isoprenylated plant protein 2-like [Carya illinoinensis]KAG6645692.1 hypothetical protein CIPAW_08G139700 [Carya illinoinensis]KAG6700956.1 hypothetical protein I3842_08G139800 [Carya illinoinensis]KAG6731004.1 hypothetical protein I3842_01G108600 [Carya illinoinensis]
MVQKTVLKVNIACLKCKKNLLKAVTSLQGVDKVEVDEAKGTLTVTGDADPYEIIVRTRKTGKFAEVVSIGAPPKPGDGQNDQKKKAQVLIPYIPQNSCFVCERVPVVHVGCRDEPYPPCCIL